MLSAVRGSKWKRFFFIGYIIAAFVGVPLLIFGFIAWRDEGFFVPGKFSALTGRGGGFYTFTLGIMCLAYAALGLQYHFTRAERPAFTVRLTNASAPRSTLAPGGRHSSFSRSTQESATRKGARGKHQ